MNPVLICHAFSTSRLNVLTLVNQFVSHTDYLDKNTKK
jgi:hypothetical protein